MHRFIHVKNHLFIPLKIKLLGQKYPEDILFIFLNKITADEPDFCKPDSHRAADSDIVFKTKSFF